MQAPLVGLPDSTLSEACYQRPQVRTTQARLGARSVSPLRGTQYQRTRGRCLAFSSVLGVGLCCILREPLRRIRSNIVFERADRETTYRSFSSKETCNTYWVVAERHSRSTAFPKLAVPRSGMCMKEPKKFRDRLAVRSSSWGSGC